MYFSFNNCAGLILNHGYNVPLISEVESGKDAQRLTLSTTPTTLHMSRSSTGELRCLMGRNRRLLYPW